MPEDGRDYGAFLGVQIIRFGKFELDARSGELCSHGLRIRLQEQPFRILLMLLEHPGEVVTREQIRQRLWPDGTFVDFDHSINAAIKRLRDALGESVTRQSYLQTLPRRGYRFIGEIRKPPLKIQAVGRAKEHTELLAGLASAKGGHGLLLCVSGEPGIGKTTLIEQFLAQTTSVQNCLVGRARCSERLAGTEAWLPWLEILDALVAAEWDTDKGSNRSIAHALKEFAPTWSALLAPALTQRESSDAPSQERLKREMCAFLRRLSRCQPVVVFVDDLHWADASSVDLLTYLTDRLDSMHVLILVAYRTSDLVLSSHPFLRVQPDLEAHGRCHEVELGFLSSRDIRTYAALQFPNHCFPTGFLDLIYEKTEGNPLFMADMFRDLRERGIIGQSAIGWELSESIERIGKGVPSSIQGMIQHKIRLMREHLPLLRVAAVQGYEFDSAVIAEVLGSDAAEIEERLEQLEIAHQFIQSIGERDLPDRTPSQRYRFVHVLYQNALYASIGPAQRANISKAVAEAFLAHYENRSGEVSIELARLFETAQDPMRAATYFQMASERAVARAANREAVALGQRGLHLLRSALKAPERDRLELLLYTTFSGALIACAGFDAEETTRAFARAHELCQQYGDVQQRFAVAWGLACAHSVSGDALRGFEMGEQMLRLAEEANDTGLRVAAHYALGDLYYWRPHYQESIYHFNRAVALYRQPEHHAAGERVIGYDPGVASAGFLAPTLWYLGFPEQALRSVTRARELASTLKSPICLAMTDFFAAITHSLRREPRLALTFAERGVSVSHEEGFEYFEAGNLVELGWAMSLMGSSADGIQKIREGLKLNESIGGTLERPYFLFALGECLARADHYAEALAVVEEAIRLGQRTASQFQEPDLLCLKADLLIRRAVPDFEEADLCVREALRLTRDTGAKSLELRAAISLCRLQQKRGYPVEWEALGEVAGFFTEGFDTEDLSEAKGLLASREMHR